jgi:magnesium transporter
METLQAHLEQILQWIKDDDLKSIKTLLNVLDPAEIANVVELLKEEQQALVYRLLPKDLALHVFEELEVDVQQSLIQSFRIDKAAEYFRFLEPDDKAALMDELPAKVTRLLLSRIDKEEHKRVLLLMGYDDGTAGHMMTPKYYRFTPDMTVEQAIQKIRQSKEDVEAIYHLYVTDTQRKLIGEILLRDLIFEDTEKKLQDIMTKDPISALATMYDEDVAYMLQEFDLLAIPVVDKEHRLIGVVTVDDAMDVLEEEAIDQAFNKAGLIELRATEGDRSRILTSGSLWDIWKVRIPFLIITLAGGLFAGSLIEQFEETLLSVVAVAFFIPVVMDMGGNVGTQSSTIFTRALAFGQIDLKRSWGQLFREILVGVTMGLILGVPAILMIWLWQGDLTLGLVVGASLIVTITFASMLGYVVPYTLYKLGFDQAAGADPIITTLKDITGLLIYFALATTFLL